VNHPILGAFVVWLAYCIFGTALGLIIQDGWLAALRFGFGLPTFIAFIGAMVFYGLWLAGAPI
jgi:hypothetical protein